MPHVPLIGAPPNFITIPQKLSMWGNDLHGDCVTAEEAFAKACNNPEIFIPDADVIAWAKRHGVLENGTLADVLTLMQNDGFPQGSTLYNNGPHFSVDWTNAATLQRAIASGPVKLAIAADQIETAWRTTGGWSGWFATGLHADENCDQSVSLCGYGSISWLAQQLNVQVPAGIDGTMPGYAMFVWSSIGIIDVASMIAITCEAWLRQPTTVTSVINPNYCCLQVKHSGQYLNILNESMSNGAMACQGTNNTTDNFLWQIMDAGGGYFFLRAKHSGQYLNILNASMTNGAMACQGTNNATDNFLWLFLSTSGLPLTGLPAPGTEFLLKVKSSWQYLNILNAAMNNGAEACQGSLPTTLNFVWKIV